MKKGEDRIVSFRIAAADESEQGCESAFFLGQEGRTKENCWLSTQKFFLKDISRIFMNEDEDDDCGGDEHE